MSQLTGTPTDDALTGTDVDDVLNANWSTGEDAMKGGLGDDTYYVNSHGDTVAEDADAGHDLVLAGISYTLGDNVEDLTLLGKAALGIGNALDNSLTGNDFVNTLRGLDGNDVLQGLGGNDTLDGGQGNDFLDGGAGDDLMSGGAGNDVYYVDSSGDRVVESAVAYDPANPDAYYAQNDTVVASIDYTLGDNVEDLQLDGTAHNGTGNALDNIILGNGYDNVLIGGDGNDTLVSDAGNDILRGGNGVDTLDGGTGNDVMVGGDGADEYWVDSAGDRVIEKAGDSGGDVVISTVDITKLYDNVEGVELQGDATRAVGNSLDNWMYGSLGSDTLSGKDGNDYIVGGDGADKLNGGNGDDLIVGGNDRTGTDDWVDQLTGGAGHDTFLFVAVGQGMPVDRITDFNGAEDKISLCTSAYTGEVSPTVINADGTLKADALHVVAGYDGQGSGAAGIYVDARTGNLWYDPSGDTGGDAVLFAHISSGATATVTAQDFILS